MQPDQGSWHSETNDPRSLLGTALQGMKGTLLPSASYQEGSLLFKGEVSSVSRRISGLVSIPQTCQCHSCNPETSDLELQTVSKRHVTFTILDWVGCGKLLDEAIHAFILTT